MQILKWAAEEIRIGEVDGALIGVVSTGGALKRD